MTTNFEAYIDGLGQLSDDDLYLDIDDTMKLREATKYKEEEDNRNATRKNRHNSGKR